jgi:carbamoyltransferase
MAQSPPGRGRNGGLILGINCVFQESSACLFAGNRLVAYAEEERLGPRVKKGKRPEIDNPDQLPVHAIAYCLKTAGATLADVDLIGYSYNPDRPVLIDNMVAGSWGTPEGEAVFQDHIRRVPGLLSELAGTDVTGRFHWIDHHLTHAASAYFASPYDRAAILSADGRGESTTTLLGHGRGPTMEVLAELEYPHSLGFLWEAFSIHLGLNQYEGPGKLMGLAGFGRRERFADELGKILTLEPDGFRVEGSFLRLLECGVPAPLLEELFGPPRQPGESMNGRHADIAAALQAATEEVLLATVIRLRRETGADALCMAGGVALNCVAVGRIAQEAGYRELFVQPAAGDAGTALGAALHLLHGELGLPDRWVMTRPYLGESFTDAQIVQALDDAGLTYTRPQDIAATVAGLIADGNLVGWFQGEAEGGPRALGNRSLLADPRDPRMLDRLNLQVKDREIYRPVAPSVLADAAAAWMDVGPTAGLAHGTMNLVYRVHPNQAQRIPAVYHADGTTRAQLVTRELNRRYYEVIRAFFQITGVPMVVNTSLNGPGQPIVNTPTEAIALYLRTGMDALALGDYLVRKEA